MKYILQKVSNLKMGVFVFLGLYESKKCVKHQTLCQKLLTMVLLCDTLGVLPMAHFILRTTHPFRECID